MAPSSPITQVILQAFHDNIFLGIFLRLLLKNSDLGFPLSIVDSPGVLPGLKLIRLCTIAYPRLSLCFERCTSDEGQFSNSSKKFRSSSSSNIFLVFSMKEESFLIKPQRACVSLEFHRASLATYMVLHGRICSFSSAFSSSQEHVLPRLYPP